jgi:hypothetical protein
MAPKKKATIAPGGASVGKGTMSAESLHLNPSWQVGRLLGQGAQASVHALVDVRRGSSNAGKECEDFVVKLAKLPETMAPPKRKKSLVEINADALNAEYLCYLNLRAAQGTYIPFLPAYYKPAEPRSSTTTPSPSPFPPDRGQIVVNGTYLSKRKKKANGHKFNPCSPLLFVLFVISKARPRSAI